MMKKKWFMALIILVIIGAVIVGIYLISRPTIEEVETIKEGEALEYELVSGKEDPKSCWVVVKTEQIPSKDRLKATAFKVWVSEKKENVFLYLPDMNTGLAAYGVAKFISRGLTEFRINPSALEGTKWESK